MVLELPVEAVLQQTVVPCTRNCAEHFPAAGMCQQGCWCLEEQLLTVRLHTQLHAIGRWGHHTSYYVVCTSSAMQCWLHGGLRLGRAAKHRGLFKAGPCSLLAHVICTVVHLCGALIFLFHGGRHNQQLPRGYSHSVKPRDSAGCPSQLPPRLVARLTNPLSAFGGSFDGLLMLFVRVLLLLGGCAAVHHHHCHLLAAAGRCLGQQQLLQSLLAVKHSSKACGRAGQRWTAAL